MQANKDSSSNTETTPSPPSSEHDQEDETDSEPDTDDVFEEPSTRRNSSTKPDILDQYETDSDDDSKDPQLRDFRDFRKIVQERKRQREEAMLREANRREDSDPGLEGPGPAAPSSPMRGLLTGHMQPPPHHHHHRARHQSCHLRLRQQAQG